MSAERLKKLKIGLIAKTVSESPSPTTHIHVYPDNVTDSVLFILWNIPILLVLALDLKGIINTLKRYFVAMECADVVAFTFAT